MEGGRRHKEEKRCHLTVAGLREQAGGSPALYSSPPSLEGRMALSGREWLQDDRQMQGVVPVRPIKGCSGIRGIDDLW